MVIIISVLTETLRVLSPNQPWDKEIYDPEIGPEAKTCKRNLKPDLLKSELIIMLYTLRIQILMALWISNLQYD